MAKRSQKSAKGLFQQKSKAMIKFDFKPLAPLRLPSIPQMKFPREGIPDEIQVVEGPWRADRKNPGENPLERNPCLSNRYPYNQ
jgi:hypothetical protein